MTEKRSEENFDRRRIKTLKNGLMATRGSTTRRRLDDDTRPSHPMPQDQRPGPSGWEIVVHNTTYEVSGSWRKRSQVETGSKVRQIHYEAVTCTLS